MAISNMITVGLKINQPTVLFQANSKNDIVLTVDLKSAVADAIEVVLYVTKSLETQVSENRKTRLTISPNGNKKRQNIEVPPGFLLVAVSPTSAVQAKVYQAALFTKPGEIVINPGETKSVEVFLDANVGEKAIRCICQNSGIKIKSTSATISCTAPVTFLITREDSNNNEAVVQFVIDDLKLSTQITISQSADSIASWSDGQMMNFYELARNKKMS